MLCRELCPMIAKIGHGANLFGVLSYNHQKVREGSAVVLCLEKVADSWQVEGSLQNILGSFEPFLAANRRTEKPVLHISLNPHPKDKVDDDTFAALAREYMEMMGYGAQPFVVYKHTDIDRTHIHIVSVCIDQDGRKIDDRFEKRRSMDVCRALEQKYRLRPLSETAERENPRVFRPVRFREGDLKSQIAAVVRYLPAYYHFQGMGAYNALLSLYNITAEEVKGELQGQPKAGLVYFALNEKGEKCSNPFKASLFGKYAGYVQLQDHFKVSGERMKEGPGRGRLKKTIETAISGSRNEKQFRNVLRKANIEVVCRRNGDGRLYGITFIDHRSRTVWNGSQLGKDLAANRFQEWWTGGDKPMAPLQKETTVYRHIPIENRTRGAELQPGQNPEPDEGITSFFDFLLDDPWLYPEEQGSFIRKKKRRKRRRNEQTGL